jgi:hypothetical protein
MLLTPRTILLTLLAGALSGGATWWVGKFAMTRLLAIGHTTTDQSVGASVISSMAMLGVMALATLVTIALLVIAGVAKSAAVKGRFLRGGLVGVGFLTGALAAIYLGLYVLTTPATGQ